MSEAAEHEATTREKGCRVERLSVVLSFAIGAACVVILLTPGIPLGIVGEWVWNRTGAFPRPERWLLPIAAFAGYVMAVTIGRRLLERHGEWLLVVLLPALLGAGGLLQLAWLDLPPPPWGIERWPISLAHPASSGYFAHAGTIGNPKAFLADYERWIAHQDSFHVGTHPPGLFLVCRFLLDYFGERPQAAAALLEKLPQRLRMGLATLEQKPGLSRAAQAAVAAMAVLTFVVCLLTILPIYGLCRLGVGPAPAWQAATIWPLVPAVPLFLPVGDCLYPPLAALLVLLLLWSAEARLAFPAVLAGAVFWFGMLFSLAFLAVLPIAFGAHFTYFWRGKMSIGRWLTTVAAFAAGFALPTEWCWRQLDLNLPVVWFINLDKHAGFYVERPMSYWPWLGLNLVELAFVCGPVVMGCFVAALALGRERRQWNGLTAAHCAAAATIVLLDVIGRNRGEVGRLWLPLIPFFALPVARVWAARQIGAAPTVAWLLWQVLVGWLLTASVEPLLPIAAPVAADVSTA